MNVALKIAVVPGPGAPEGFESFVGKEGASTWDPAQVESSGFHSTQSFKDARLTGVPLAAYQRCVTI